MKTILSPRAPGRVAVLAAALVLTMLLTGSALADTEGAGTVTASALNLRSEASTSSSILACVSQGTVVLVTGSADGWYKVSYNGQEGYMSSQYISFADTATSDFGTGTIQGTGVRVRSGPGTSNSILGSCNTGTTLPVTGVSGGWYQVTYNGSTGYVSSSYLSVSSAGSGSADNAPALVSTDSGSASGTGTIQGTYVRMRSGPGTSYSILGTYNTGTVMTVTGTSGDWTAVNYNGTDGYVYSTYLSTGSSGGSADSGSGTTYTVNASVNVRSGPGTSYGILTWYASGKTVTVTGTEGKWSRISYDGGSAYIFSSYLTQGGGSSSSDSGGSSGSSASSSQQAIVVEAKKYLGVPYVYGGTSPSGFDCSGFVYYVYKQCGYSIYRTATAQYQNGTYVDRSDLQPGDIIIFYNSAMSAIGHAGLYIGDGQFIHASSGSGAVVISSLSASYYNSHYYGARRVVG